MPEQDVQQFDPNQIEAVKRRSSCLDFMVEVARRGNGIGMWDAQVLTQLVGNLYRILPVHNAPDLETGEEFEGARLRLLDRIRDISEGTFSEEDEITLGKPKEQFEESDSAFLTWMENEKFIERCTQFMNDTLFVKPTKRGKKPTEGPGYA